MVRVTAFVAHYLPGTRAGGPTVSMANLVRAVGDEIAFSILTSHNDFGESTPYAGIETFRWLQNTKARVMYLAPGLRGAWALVKAALDDEADVIYVNSLFEPRFSVLPLWARVLGGKRLDNVVIAPRGETAKEALGHHPGRKRAYLAALRAFGVPKRVVWVSSTEFERCDIERTFGSEVTIRIASDLPTAPDSDTPRLAVSKVPGTLNVVLVGRVHPHKGIDIALELLARVDGKIQFEIAGPIEDANYWARCQQTIAQLPERVTVRYLGNIDRRQLAETLSRAHLFLLPTRSENFGHAIAEALAAGVPVLIGDTTPWRNLAEAGVGWDLPLAQRDRWCEVIGEVMAMGDDAHGEVRERARAYARQHAAAPELLEANRAVFAEAAARLNRTTAPSSNGRGVSSVA